MTSRDDEPELEPMDATTGSSVENPHIGEGTSNENTGRRAQLLVLNWPQDEPLQKRLLQKALQTWFNKNMPDTSCTIKSLSDMCAEVIIQPGSALEHRLMSQEISLPVKDKITATMKFGYLPAADIQTQTPDSSSSATQDCVEMASASSLLSEEQFLCSICLDVFTDPITTSCGHNYCKTCITNHWDSSTDVWKCPLCNKTFYRRPESSVNEVLSEMADQFRKSKLKQTSSTNLEPAEPDEVSCDFCTEPKLKAVKSCLVCLASYCETHLEPHHRVTAFKRHKLIDPVKNLEDFVCKKHDRPLELFCKTDHTCVCQFCTETDHKFHRIISLKEAYDGKKAELGNTEAEVQQMIQERQLKIYKVKHSVQLSKKDADREITDGVKVFTALISCIERSQAELMNVIEEKHKTTEKKAEGFIKELQQEINQLKKRSSELKQLSHTEDHLQLLQNAISINTPVPSKDWSKVSVHPSSYVGTVRTAVDQLKKTLSEEMEKQSHLTTQEISMVKKDPLRGQETEVNVPSPSRGQETEFSVPFPQRHFAYLNQAYREEMKRIERENGVTITAELKVSFEVDQKNNGSSQNPERALTEFTNLGQKRLGDFGSVTVPLKHADQGDWKRMLENIQRENSKLVLTACCGEMTVSGPSKSVGDVRQSLQISQRT